MPRFSVVVTVRNDEFDLRELLAALEAQTRAPEEVVVVDGGSIDGTLDVLRGWRPERFPVRVLVEPGSTSPRAATPGSGQPSPSGSLAPMPGACPTVA